MSPELAQTIRNHPRFAELVRKRKRLAIQLSLIMLAVYFSFILVIAFHPEVLGVSVGGGVITLGIPVGVGIIIVAFLLTGFYVRRANREFDGITNEIKQAIER